MANEWLLTPEEVINAKSPFMDEVRRLAILSDTAKEWEEVMTKMQNAVYQAQHTKTLKLLESKGMLRHSYIDGMQNAGTPCRVCALLREMGVSK